MRYRLCGVIVLIAGAACAPQLGPVGETAGQAEASAPAESMWRDQKLIRNGEIELEVANVGAAVQAAATIAAEQDGMVADSELAETSRRGPFARISVRVAADKLDATLARFRELGTVAREGVSTEEVTKQYLDIETRLSVKRQTSERILDLLKNRTGVLADVVAAEAELSRVTEEIERLEGEKRFYDHRIATSTITVTLRETGSFLSSVIGPIRRAFAEAGTVLGSSLQSMTYLVVFSAPWVVVILAVVWFVRRRARKSRPQAPAGVDA